MLKLNNAQQAIIDAMSIDRMQKHGNDKLIFKKTSSKKFGVNLNTTKAKGSASHLVMDRVYAGKVLAAIPRTRIIETIAWFAYGPELQIGEFERVLQFVYTAFATESIYSGLTKKFKHSRRINDLIVYATLNFRYNRTGSRDRYSTADICKGSDIPEQNWARDWEKVYTELCLILEKADHKILAPVIKLIKNERKKEECA